MNKRVLILVKGRVHGVGFRYSTKRNALSCDLTGYVRNVPEGVEVVAEGKEEDLKKLAEFCRKGPMFARVDETEVKHYCATGEFPDFEIRR